LRYYTYLALVLFGASKHAQAFDKPCQNVVDIVDPTYRGKIRQMVKPDGHEHNLYYYRNPWNADSTRMVGVHSDLESKNWRVVLYSGDGCFIKDLFPTSQFGWTLVWDRHDPHTLFTLKGNELYRFNVTNGKAELAKSFAPQGMKPNGPSLNQAGDRLLVTTSDGVFRSYRLPGMDDERTFSIEPTALCNAANIKWDKPRYIGYRNYIDVYCPEGTAIYDDTGALVHMFKGIGGGGHHDFSPDGKWAYSPHHRFGQGKPLEIHVVNVDGSDDRVVYSVPDAQMRFVRNLHLAWPSGVSDWFVASFFPDINNQPGSYAPMLDEIVQIHLDGTVKALARTGTSSGNDAMFWAQPLARPNHDGTRINFNSNRSGTIDQYILFLDQPADSLRNVTESRP